MCDISGSTQIHGKLSLDYRVTVILQWRPEFEAPTKWTYPNQILWGDRLFIVDCIVLYCVPLESELHLIASVNSVLTVQLKFAQVLAAQTIEAISSQSTTGLTLLGDHLKIWLF